MTETIAAVLLILYLVTGALVTITFFRCEIWTIKSEVTLQDIVAGTIGTAIWPVIAGTWLFLKSEDIVLYRKKEKEGEQQ